VLDLENKTFQRKTNIHRKLRKKKGKKKEKGGEKAKREKCQYLSRGTSGGKKLSCRCVNLASESS